MILPVLGSTLPVLVCLVALGRGAGRRDVLRLVPIAVGLGLGGASLVWWLLMQLPLPSARWLPPLDAMVWMAAGIAVLRSTSPVWPMSTSATGRDRSTRLATWAAVVLLAPLGALAIASFIGANLVTPHGEWDAWAIWNQHARLFARGYPAVWRDGFSPLLVWFHPSYPLLIPLSVARGWVFAGRETVLVPIGLAALFAVSTVLVAATSVGRSRTTARGLATAAILLASPVFVREAAGQIADIPLSFYILTTFVLIAHGIESGSSRWWRIAGASAGFAAWTKDEGGVFVLLLFSVCGVRAARSGGWQGVKRLRPLIAGAMPSLVALAIFKVWLAPSNDLVTAQTLSHVVASVADPGRLKMVTEAFARELWTGGATVIGVLPILALSVAVSGVRRPLPAAPALAAITVIGLVSADALVYVLTPYSLTWHLGTSLGRVLLQVFPTIVWAAMMVSGRDAETMPVGRRGIAYLVATLGAVTTIGAAPTAPPPQKMADWLTDGGDPHRTAWQQQETALSPATVSGMTRLWTIHLDNVPRQMHALFPALIAGRVDTSTGPKQIAVIAGSSDNLYGIDVEAGAVLWKRHFDRGFSPPINGRPPSTLCPGGLTATPVLAPAATPGQYVVYAVTWDGHLRTVDVATGDEIQPPAKFLPPNGKPYALNLWNGVIYTATAEACGDNLDAVYAFDLETRRVARFAPNGGGLWGRTGPSIGADGTVYTPTGDGAFSPRQRLYGQAIVGLTRHPVTGALTLKDYFAPPNAAWMTDRDLDMNVTGPVFTVKGRELMAQSSKECRLWLLDTSALGGADHRTAAYASPVLCNEQADWESAGVWGAMATWEDPAGTRWLATPFWGPKVASFAAPIEHGNITHGAVAAFTIADQNGRPALVPRWISRDMNRADPPVVANGVLFGYGAGESTKQRWATDGQRIDPTDGRISQSTRAVIYALDASSGAELWSSGDEITSWNHFSGLSVANGRVYIGTYDGNLYCFGLKGAPVTGRRPSSR